jgi:soluble lytic murein transglycosylase
MRSILLSVGILSTILSCSSLSVKQNLPPENLKTVFKVGMSQSERREAEATLDRFALENKDSASLWWVAYNRAMIVAEFEPPKACVLFKDLSQQSDFPLQPIASLRAHETCVTTPDSAQQLWALSKSVPSWAQVLATNLSVITAHKISAKKEQMGFLIERAKQTDIGEEKLELYQRAITLAQDIGDKDAELKTKKKLYQVAPRFNENPNRDEFAKVAHDSRRARQFDRARDLYRRVFEDRTRKVEERIAALKGIRFAYKTENKKEEYILATHKISEFSEALTKKKRAPASRVADFIDSQLLLTRTLWTAGDVQGSMKVLSTLASKYKNRPEMSEVYWLKARISEEAGQYDEAIRMNRVALSLERAGTALWEKLLWQKAWNLRKQKDFSQSAIIFQTLIEKTKQSDSYSKYRFWYGRVLKENNQIEEAARTFASLIVDDPMGYYGLLSYRESGLKFPPLTSKSTRILEKPSFVNESDYKMIKWLASVGENELLRSMMKQVTAKTQFLKMNLEDQSKVLNWYASVGDYLGLFQQYGWILSTQKDLLARHVDLIFPKPHESFVKRAADTNGVPVELIYSIMRQESGFNPRARSPMDAFGLMQLTPFTAEKMARDSAFDYKQADDLYRPQLNISMGSAFLKRLLDQFDQQFIMTVASYNASEDAVMMWLKTRYRGDPLEFIEDIPYSETMTYIKLVLRNFIYYSRLASQDDAMKFPEWCLEGLQSLKTSSIESPSAIQ